WIVLVALLSMEKYTAMSSRIGVDHDKLLLTLIKARFGKGIGVAIGVGIYLEATSFQAGNGSGGGIAIGYVTVLAMYIWIIVFTAIAIALLFFPSFYKIMEKVMLILVLLMLTCFMATLFLADIQFDKLFTGFVPTIPDGSLGLLIAFTASCFSLVGAFYQTYLIQERRSEERRVGKESRYR